MCSVKIKNEYLEYEYFLTKQKKFEMIMKSLKSPKCWGFRQESYDNTVMFEVTGDDGYFTVSGDIVTEKYGNNITLKSDTDNILKRFLLKEMPEKMKKYIIQSLFSAQN